MKKLTLMDFLQLVAVACTGLVMVNVAHHIWQKKQPLPNLSWEAIEQRNSTVIAQLQPGVSSFDVLDRLGSANFTQAYQDLDGHQWLLLHYRTHYRHNDGLTTLDETTPLLFKNNQLVTWGHHATHKFEISRL
ncbi:MAG: DUF3192 domain-containing protein [Ferrimonas sp.]